MRIVLLTHTLFSSPSIKPEPCPIILYNLASVIGLGMDMGPKSGQSASFLAIFLSEADGKEFIFPSQRWFEPRVVLGSSLVGT